MNFAANRTPNLRDRLRDSSGLIITVAIHAGIGALALVGLGIVELPKAPPVWMVTQSIPEASPAFKLVVPKTIDQPVQIDVVAPIISIETPTAPTIAYPVTPTITETTTITTATGNGGAVVEPLPPTGPTITARLDPRYAAGFQPLYPDASRRIGEEGVVVVRVVVGIDGRVSEARVVKSSGFERLDKAALTRALTKWRFLSAQRDGVPVAAEREIPVRFQIVQE